MSESGFKTSERTYETDAEAGEKLIVLKTFRESEIRGRSVCMAEDRAEKQYFKNRRLN